MGLYGDRGEGLFLIQLSLVRKQHQDDCPWAVQTKLFRHGWIPLRYQEPWEMPGKH